MLFDTAVGAWDIHISLTSARAAKRGPPWDQSDVMGEGPVGSSLTR
jgi:hypothetical protein